MELRYQPDSPVQPFIVLMSMLRTRKYAHTLYELIKYHLWGYVDKNGIYYSIHLLHDDDFVFFKLNLNNVDEFHYIFALSLQQIYNYISPEIKEKFIKDTVEVDRSMLIWKDQIVDSA